MKLFFAFHYAIPGYTLRVDCLDENLKRNVDDLISSKGSEEWQNKTGQIGSKTSFALFLISGHILIAVKSK